MSGYRPWQLHEAKPQLSNLVRRARGEGPQRITVYLEFAEAEKRGPVRDVGL